MPRLEAGDGNGCNGKATAAFGFRSPTDQTKAFVWPACGPGLHPHSRKRLRIAAFARRLKSNLVGYARKLAHFLPSLRQKGVGGGQFALKAKETQTVCDFFGGKMVALPFQSVHFNIVRAV